MNQAEQKAAAKAFVDRWINFSGTELEGCQKYWMDLLVNVLGMSATLSGVEFERKVRGRRIDVFYEDMRVLVEQKAPGLDLDKRYERGRDEAGDARTVTPYEQGKWYADNLPRSISPRWVIVCNFTEIRIHDLDTDNPGTEFVSISLEDLPNKVHLLSFITDSSKSRLTIEKELSVKAAELVGRIYDELSCQYMNLETSTHEQRSLNVVIVRLVFLLYAEDAGLLQKHQAFLQYMKRFDARQSRQALIDLFRMLNTPYDQRDPYADPELLEFPYVNGGLFAEENIIVPQFTEQIRVDLLAEASAGFDWSGISPTIFGAAFESTLNPETRRSGGMHYTSIENIHKVIDPLFLDDLKAELAAIEGEKVQKTRNQKLKMFQRKLASINVLDPACGSGNFLTETYISLRKLENRVLEALNDGQGALGIGIDQGNTIMVNIGQLYGIEINDFAVSVAKTALWIAEAQAIDETSEVVYQVFEFLPLKSISGIVQGNALRMDWNDVLPAESCSFIIGNPPFIGSSLRNAEQRSDMDFVFGPKNKQGKCDYCVAWYEKASRYMKETSCRAALVSTNSISQGEQVAPTWQHLFENGLQIDFAWKSFVWNSESVDQAHVHCVIVGFSHSTRPKLLFDADIRKNAQNINGYLSDAPNVFIKNRGKAISTRPDIKQGNKPVDGGHLTLKPDEAKRLNASDVRLGPYIRPYLGSRELINDVERYCLWLKDAPSDVLEIAEIRERLQGVSSSRASSPTKGFRDYADKPTHFVEDRQPNTPFIAIPEVSSQRRQYIPIALLPSSTIVSNKIFFVPNGDLYLFGLLNSKVHNAWMRVIAGRLKSDYSYSPSVYNNLVFPTNVAAEQKRAIESCAQAVLDARSSYSGKSLADLYDPDKMPADLLAAHKALDAVVEAAYGVDFQGDEEKIVTHLFKLYAEATAQE